MGRKISESSASDQSPPRKARRKSLHRSRSTKSSSTAQSALGSVQQSTESQKRIESTQASGWTPTMALNESDSQRVSIPSFAVVEHCAKPGKYSLQEKKFRALAPAPTTPPHPLIPTSPKENSFIDENGRHKIRLPRRSPLPSRNDPGCRPTNTTAPPTQEHLSNAATNPSQSLSLQFDPSQCVWHALRDVAFVKDENIELSMEDLCALLRFRYAGVDARMKGVDESHVLAMRDFVKERGKQMYDVKYPRFVRTDMEVDLRSMREGREGPAGCEV